MNCHASDLGANFIRVKIAPHEKCLARKTTNSKGLAKHLSVAYTIGGFVAFLGANMVSGEGILAEIKVAFLPSGVGHKSGTSLAENTALNSTLARTADMENFVQQDSSETSAETLATTPLITGPTTILWTGAGATIAVMTLVFLLMMRGRVRRTEKAKTARTEFFEPAGDDAEIEFEDARTKDEPRADFGFAATPDDDPVTEAEFDDVENEESARDDATIELPELTAAPSEEEFEDQEDRSKGQFSGLFARRKTYVANAPAEDAEERLDDPEVERHAFATAIVDHDQDRRRDSERGDQSAAVARADHDAEEIRRRAMAEAEEAKELARAEAAETLARAEAYAEENERQDAWRRAELDKQRQLQQEEEMAMAARAEELTKKEQALTETAADMENALNMRVEGELRRIEGVIRERLPSPESFTEAIDAAVERLASVGPNTSEPNQEEIYNILAGVEEALSAQGEIVRTDQRNLISALENSMNARLGDFEQKLTPTAAAIAGLGDINGASAGGVDNDAIKDLQETVSSTLARIEGKVIASLETFGQRLDALESKPGEMVSLRNEIASLHAALDQQANNLQAPVVQLAELLKSSLPSDAFQLNAGLPGGAQADGLVQLSPSNPPIAIDAQFPLEAFSVLRKNAASAPSAADAAFRRRALRHVLKVAEELIKQPATMDAAFLFIASESMHSELQTRFSDVVRDASRVRVWIVSPVSLTASLNILRASTKTASQPAAPAPTKPTRPSGALPAHLRTAATTPNKPTAMETSAGAETGESDDAPSTLQQPHPTDPPATLR